MPEEHEGQVGDDYAWKKVLRMDKAVGTGELWRSVRLRAGTLRSGDLTGIVEVQLCNGGTPLGPLIRSNTSAHDREVFLSSWQLLFGVLSRLFEIPLDVALFPRVLVGLRNLATLAAHFRLPDALEATVCLVVCRCRWHLVVPASTGAHSLASGPLEPSPGEQLATLARAAGLRRAGRTPEGSVQFSQQLIQRLGTSDASQQTAEAFFSLARQVRMRQPRRQRARTG